MEFFGYPLYCGELLNEFALNHATANFVKNWRTNKPQQKRLSHKGRHFAPCPSRQRAESTVLPPRKRSNLAPHPFCKLFTITKMG
jgi:hypothetical protein